MNEMKNNFIDSGLEDLSVSRVGFDWGIPIKENKAHTIYVWLDALFNYVTALGFKQGNDKLYKKY
jgi:methionyl-tRNA synthetase